MSIDQLIAELQRLKEEVGGETPVLYEGLCKESLQVDKVTAILVYGAVFLSEINKPEED